MTNYEKFVEVFGFEPDKNSCVIKCPDNERETSCPYFKGEIEQSLLNRLGCKCEEWWNEKYKEESMKYSSEESPCNSCKDRYNLSCKNSCSRYKTWSLLKDKESKRQNKNNINPIKKKFDTYKDNRSQNRMKGLGKKV